MQRLTERQRRIVAGIRYGGAGVAGYPNRLHCFFSAWIADAEAKGILPGPHPWVGAVAWGGSLGRG